MGLVSRALALAEDLAPDWGMRRAIARAGISAIQASGYSHHGASRSKKAMQGWTSEGGGPDTDIGDNLDLLRERSRDLCMGEGLAMGGLKTIRTNEIGSGLRLNAQIDAAYLGMTDEEAMAWEDRTEREFALWAETSECDAERRSTFGQLQALARLSQLMSGDVFALLPAVPRTGVRYDLRVQLIEADRVSDPTPFPRDADIANGVEVGAYGEPIAYYVSEIHPGDGSRGSRLRLMRWRRVPVFGADTGRRLVLHLMESERPGQRRGVPVLAPVIEKLKQLSRYSEAELMAAVVSSFFTVAITSESPQSVLGPSIPSAQQVATPGESDNAPIQMASGMMVGLAPGESVTPINPARPNSGFDPFVVAVCRQIAAGLGLPYELLIMQFTSSYSASRAALLEAWKRFQVGRAWIVTGLCQPVYEAWLEEAVARGYVSAPGFFSDPAIRAAWCGAEWHGPTQGQLDPTKEVDAAASRVREGFSTRARETAELTGGNFERMNAARVREEKMRRDGGLVSSGAPALALTPTDQSSIATVDEGRASIGLAPKGGTDGEAWIAEHTARIAAETAPDLAKVAEASKGEPAPQEDAA